MIPNLANALLSVPVMPKPEPNKITKESTPRVRKKRSEPSERTTVSRQKNASKICTKKDCGKPRHKSESGNCWTALCTGHYIEYQEVYRNIRRASTKK